MAIQLKDYKIMKNLIIFYDNWCPNCTRFSKIVQQLDWLNLIGVKQLRNYDDVSHFPDLNITLAKKLMASLGKNWHYGFDSIFYIFMRLPLFWFFVPFLFLLKITKLGQVLYNELALKRKIIPLHCSEDSCGI